MQLVDVVAVPVVVVVVRGSVVDVVAVSDAVVGRRAAAAAAAAVGWPPRVGLFAVWVVQPWSFVLRGASPSRTVVGVAVSQRLRGHRRNQMLQQGLPRCSELGMSIDASSWASSSLASVVEDVAVVVKRSSRA